MVPKLNLTTKDKALKIAVKNIKLLILNSSSESFKKIPITITLFLFGMKPLTLKLKKQITEIAKTDRTRQTKENVKQTNGQTDNYGTK